MWLWRVIAGRSSISASRWDALSNPFSLGIMQCVSRCFLIAVRKPSTSVAFQWSEQPMQAQTTLQNHLLASSLAKRMLHIFDCPYAFILPYDLLLKCMSSKSSPPNWCPADETTTTQTGVSWNHNNIPSMNCKYTEYKHTKKGHSQQTSNHICTKQAETTSMYPD